MSRKFMYATVANGPRQVIHVVRVVDDILNYPEIDGIAEAMRARMLSRYGEQMPNVVVVQGAGKETLCLFGDSQAVTRVRTAMFNAAVRWSPLQLD
jgi:hypothetical protein